MARHLMRGWQDSLDALVRNHLEAQGIDSKALFNACTNYTIERSNDSYPVLVFRVPVFGGNESRSIDDSKEA